MVRLAHGAFIDIWYGMVDVWRRIPGVEATCEAFGALIEDATDWLDVVLPFVFVLAAVAGAVFGLGFLLHAGWAAL